jgi:RNA polymerase sigma-70 factor, ECF subfamily
MAPDTHDSGADLERFREKLKHLAERQVDRRLWDRLDLSGIVQQTLLEAHQARDKFEPLSEADKPAWLGRALANNLKDALAELKTRKRDIGRESFLEAAVDESSARVAAWLASEETSPSQKAIRNEQLLRLHAALERLSPERRKVVELHLEGLKLETIAQTLGKTKAAVAQLLHRGIEDLTHLLDHA